MADEQAAQPPESADRIAEARALAERMEKANKETRELINRQQAIKAEEILAGRSVATKPANELSQDEKEIAAARKMLQGTGYEDDLFPLK